MNKGILEDRFTVQEKEYEIPYHYLIRRDRLIALPDKIISSPHYIFYLEKVVSMLKPFKGEKLLDIGCGDGRLCYELRSEDVAVHGIDYSRRALGFAAVMNPQSEFRIGDITKRLPYSENAFDLAVMIETLEHIPPDKVSHAMDELHRVLKPCGRVVITVPHQNRKLDTKHYQHFDSKQLRDIVSRRFRVDVLKGYHKKSWMLNGLLSIWMALFYWGYPFRKFGLSNLLDSMGESGFLYFSRYLANCPPDRGLALICSGFKAES
jgi:ubiquinone/menaquinone biosynthesis C-methylase UbiE